MKQQINKEQLEDVLQEAIEEAQDFNLPGWGIPIIMDEEDGEIRKNSWLSQNTWIEGVIELTRVEPWTLNDWDGIIEENLTAEENLDVRQDIMCELRIFYMNKIKEKIEEKYQDTIEIVE